MHAYTYVCVFEQRTHVCIGCWIGGGEGTLKCLFFPIRLVGSQTVAAAARDHMSFSPNGHDFPSWNVSSGTAQSSRFFRVLSGNTEIDIFSGCWMIYRKSSSCLCLYFFWINNKILIIITLVYTVNCDLFYNKMYYSFKCHLNIRKSVFLWSF